MLNAKQERFAQSLAQGMTASAAYKAAGYAATKDGAVRANASRLLTNANVKFHIAGLQRQAADHTLVTIESIAWQLDEDRQLAFAQGQASAAVAASVAKAKLYGLVIDKAEVETALRKPMREPGEVRQQMSLEEWVERFKPKGVEHGAPAVAPQPEPPVADPPKMSLMEIVKARMASREQTY